ncbi:CRISPR-associated helicase Cas3' [Micromonospora sonneratiae]|uniref:CRISPR-associated helicase Cas3 n=1 Tax=Micromonospora sonneratiae TaxID=1184706 RepID=A0ABW3YQC4_9ACTN
MDHDMPDVDLRVWGKSKGLASPYPLIWHLVDTAAVARALWDRYLTAGQRRTIADGMGAAEEQAKSLVMLWAALHDLGKATPGFQGHDPGAAACLAGDPDFGLERGSKPLRHERATHLSLMELLAGYGYANLGPFSRRPCYLVAQMLGGHHGEFRRAEVHDPDRRYLGGAGWGRQRSALVRILDQVLGCPKPPDALSGPTMVLVTGLIILADWLVSQESFLRKQLKVVPSDVSVEIVAAHLAALRKPVERLLDEAGLGRPRLGAAAFTEIYPFAPNALQQSLIDELLPQVDGPGLLVVTAATGDGKTEAAMVPARVLAERCGASGFYFALPTMATADQMYKRTREFVAKLAEEQTALTLLHSMSWLNPAYQTQVAVQSASPSAITSTDEDTRVVAPRWLRGRKRGLLASFAVGTIDQALVGVLTTKHNVLRLLGLSSKVFIVDEAHAYDEYMQRVLCKLLDWLGAFGCPVILLSATIPVSQVRKLAAAYQHGAGVASPAVVEINYPGWTFVPAQPGRDPITISPSAQARVVSGRSIDLEVDVRPVRHLATNEADGQDHLDRRAVIRNCLAPLLEQGGCAAVVCNTVADSQATYKVLRDWGGADVEVRLLHSRFPAWQREEITEEITTRLGKNADNRPTRMIVVATQVIEQSLDLDFDLVVSDLAPMAQLLQRAGRCQRHRHHRYPWAPRPRLVILDPRGGSGYSKPVHWGDVYHPYLLRATHLRLADVTRIAIPEDVQGHVEAVYGPPSATIPELDSEYVDYMSCGIASRQVADLGLVPDAANVGDLAYLSGDGISEERASTRLGADSVRVVCCYQDGSGDRWLDERGTRPLPLVGARHDGSLSFDQVREILAHGIPVRESLLPGYAPTAGLPDAWQDNAWLSEIRLLNFDLSPDGVAPIDVGDRRIWLDAELGLIVHKGATR